MRHVIVIETVDDDTGRIPQPLQDAFIKAAEIGCEMEGIACFVQGRFNEDSAIAAVHEMYNAPKWDGAA